MALHRYFFLFSLFLAACNPATQNNEALDGNNQDSATTQQQNNISEETHGPQLFPVDDAPKDTSFLHFRERLLEAINSKNEKFLYSILDENIRIGFGDGGGIEDFKKQWKPEQENSAIWPMLERMLKMGGSLRNTSPGNNNFVTPYVYAIWPDSLDAFTHIALTGKMVPVRKEPSENAQVLATLSYDIVKTDPDKSISQTTTEEQIHQNPAGGKEWYFIISKDAEIQGFVSWKDIYSPVSYRAIFSKNNGNWKMMLLVSGD